MNLLVPARRKRAFINQLPPSARVLDVGCGSGSPYLVKSLRPDIHYVGLDVGDYFQTEETKACADEYVIVSPEEFDGKIEQLGTSKFDAVISSHNIEHCSRPDRVLSAMCSALGRKGLLYLAFPCEASVGFPSRAGTLNFFDDPTHREIPIWKDILARLEASEMEIVFAAQRYRPWQSVLIGIAFEPLVAPLKRQAPRGGTWALYGFESIIWARRR